MSRRDLPVRPDLDHLKRQAKDLLKAIHQGEPGALAEFREHHPHPPDPAEAKLSDAQLALARAYHASSWPRLVQGCDLVSAIWRDDQETVRALIRRNPDLLHEDALIRKNSSWGPPMSYAANLGRDRIIRMLHDLGARDHRYAMDRALLQSRIDTAALLHRLAGSPPVPDGALAGPAYTLSDSGTAFALRLGAKAVDASGRCIAPVDVVLETDSRKPEAKHAILEMYATHGVVFPDTPVMALHRGRIDLLEAHVRRDPAVLNRTWTHEEIYPPEFGCHDEVLATQGTPLKGTTLLHLCADYDEFEIATWLISKGADVNTRAAVDPDGFGGHTALFGTVISQPASWMNHKGLPQEASFTRLFLDHGADPNVRASLRKKLHPGYGEDELHEFRDVTALSWGRLYPHKRFVSRPALELIEAAGGRE